MRFGRKKKSSESNKRDVIRIYQTLTKDSLSSSEVAKLTSWLCSQSAEERLGLSQSFSDNYFLKLSDVIHHRLAAEHELRDMLVALTSEPIEWITSQVAQSINTVELRDKARLLTILLTVPTWVMQKIRMKYEEIFGQRMTDMMAKHNMIPHRSLLRSIVTGERSVDDSPDVVHTYAKDLHQKLIESGDPGSISYNETLIEILATQSWDVIKMLYHIETVNTSCLNGDLSLRASALILEYADNSIGFWARRLHKQPEALQVKIFFDEEYADRVYNVYKDSSLPTTESEPEEWLQLMFNRNYSRKHHTMRALSNCFHR